MGMHKVSSGDALSSVQSAQQSPQSSSPDRQQFHGGRAAFGAQPSDFGTVSEDGRCAARSGPQGTMRS